jgi:hypothetical protein
MTLVEANELFSCMNFSLEESEERALESAQQKVSFLVSMESLIDHDSEYSSAMEGALDTIKNAMKKVKEAFHKLIIKFGLIVRNFQHRAQAKTLASDILLLGNRGLEVPAALLGKIYELKDAFNAVGLKDSWKTETQGSMFDYNASRILTLPEIKRNIRDITSKASEIDGKLEDWLDNPNPEVDTKKLREDASKCTKAINLTINFLNLYVLSIQKQTVDAQKAAKKNAKSEGKSKEKKDQ